MSAQIEQYPVYIVDFANGHVDRNLKTPQPPAKELWFMIRQGNTGKWAFQCPATGHYLCVEDNGKVPVVNRSAVGAWEQFTLVDNGDGTFGIKTHHNTYLCAENGKIVADRSSIGGWEKFHIQSAATGLALAIKH